MDENFNFFIPLSKVDKETRTVSGYASTPALDLDGEIITLDAVKKALPGYMAWRNIRRMHTNDAVGVAQEANVDAKGLFLTAKIVDDDAWNKCLEGVYKGFSIGGKKLNKSGNTITAIDLVEISIVDRPANSECKFDVAKRAGEGVAAFLTKLPKETRDPRDKAIGLMAKTVSTMARSNPPAARDGLSLPAPVKCKEHGVLDCQECAKVAKDAATECQAHGKLNCKNCADKAAEAAEIEKRNVSSSERKNLAGKGDANPDGSFPIADKSDLKNAIKLVGHGDKKKNKALIVRRARELGATDMIPGKWAKKAAKKDAKEAQKAAKDAGVPKVKKSVTFGPEFEAGEALKKFLSQEPDFLTLNSGDDRAVAVEGISGHALDGEIILPQKSGLKKRMRVAGDLSGVFDQIRSSQRSLMMEGKAEGKDSTDFALAKELGEIAERVAGVIGQKATHEAGEARDLSDVDDQWLVNTLQNGDFEMAIQGDDLGNAILNVLKRAAAPSPMMHFKKGKEEMKKAKESRKEAEEAIKAAHDGLKKTYLAKGILLAKAGKKTKEDDDEMEDMGKALQALVKAHGALGVMKTFTKSATQSFAKAASGRIGNGGTGPGDLNEFHTYAPGFEAKSQDELVHAGPGDKTRGSSPAPLDMFTDARNNKSAKSRNADFVTAREAELMAKNAALEATNTFLGRLPAGGQNRPAAMDLTKFVGGDREQADLFKGVNTAAIGSGNEQAHKAAVGTVITNMIAGGHGKSVWDPSFKGTAGLKRAS